jgi:hypothetical protein
MILWGLEGLAIIIPELKDVGVLSVLFIAYLFKISLLLRLPR